MKRTIVVVHATQPEVKFDSGNPLPFKDFFLFPARKLVMNSGGSVLVLMFFDGSDPEDGGEGVHRVMLPEDNEGFFTHSQEFAERFFTQLGMVWWTHFGLRTYSEHVQEGTYEEYVEEQLLRLMQDEQARIIEIPRCVKIPETLPEAELYARSLEETFT